jgi:hypothetical protein
MDAWVTELKQRFQCQPIAIALEQSRCSVIAKLVKYDNLVLYPINPRSAAAYRNTGSAQESDKCRAISDLVN